LDERTASTFRVKFWHILPTHISYNCLDMCISVRTCTCMHVHCSEMSDLWHNLWKNALHSYVFFLRKLSLLDKCIRWICIPQQSDFVVFIQMTKNGIKLKTRTAKSLPAFNGFQFLYNPISTQLSYLNYSINFNLHSVLVIVLAKYFIYCYFLFEHPKLVG
jgi:hypothetical protein